MILTRIALINKLFDLGTIASRDEVIFRCKSGSTIFIANSIVDIYQSNNKVVIEVEVDTNLMGHTPNSPGAK